ncbi:hypothetical protein Agub_g11383, partial [Astrephomene gubernaculifera]
MGNQTSGEAGASAETEDSVLPITEAPAQDNTSRHLREQDSLVRYDTVTIDKNDVVNLPPREGLRNDIPRGAPGLGSGADTSAGGYPISSPLGLAASAPSVSYLAQRTVEDAHVPEQAASGLPPRNPSSRTWEMDRQGAGPPLRPPGPQSLSSINSLTAWDVEAEALPLRPPPPPQPPPPSNPATTSTTATPITYMTVSDVETADELADAATEAAAAAAAPHKRSSSQPPSPSRPPPKHHNHHHHPQQQQHQPLLQDADDVSSMLLQPRPSSDSYGSGPRSLGLRPREARPDSPSWRRSSSRRRVGSFGSFGAASGDSCGARISEESDTEAACRTRGLDTMTSPRGAHNTGTAAAAVANASMLAAAAVAPLPAVAATAAAAALAPVGPPPLRVPPHNVMPLQVPSPAGAPAAAATTPTPTTATRGGGSRW